jgi:hypothetical protein
VRVFKQYLIFCSFAKFKATFVDIICLLTLDLDFLIFVSSVIIMWIFSFRNSSITFLSSLSQVETIIKEFLNIFL